MCAYTSYIIAQCFLCDEKPYDDRNALRIVIADILSRELYVLLVWNRKKLFQLQVLFNYFLSKVIFFK